jgi:VWFA-related protein
MAQIVRDTNGSVERPARVHPRTPPSIVTLTTWLLRAAAVIAAAVPLGGQQPPPAAPPPSIPAEQPVFRSGVDIVVIEATVVDDDGVVARGLTPRDFRVEIGGRPREVVSADFVEHTPAPTLRVPSDVSTNVDAGPARTILLVVDHSSLRVESRDVLQSAARWTSTLGERDRLGLVSLPHSGPRVEFTTEHERVREALGGIALAPAARIGPVTLRNVSVWEGLSINNGDTFVLGEVVARECRPRDFICPQDVLMVARDIGRDAQFRVDSVLAPLRALLRALAVLPGPKHVVLLSAGWPIDERKAAVEIGDVAAEAARANVTVHTFTTAQWAMAAAVSRPSPTAGRDQNLLLSTVEMLSGLTGGQAARLVGDGHVAFEALDHGLTGFYRLGVRALPEDVDGRARRIAVKLERGGLSLSSHRKVMAGVRPAAAAPGPPGDPADALRVALERPTLATDLDLRATSYVLHDEANTRATVRVVVVGDIGRAAAGPAMTLAVLYDDEGRPVANSGQTIEIARGQPGRFLGALAVKPGRYRLRVAVRDAAGQIGTLERGVEAAWVPAGSAETTGLVLFRQRGPGAALEPVLETVSPADHVVSQLALGAGAAGPVPAIEIAITADGGAEPLLTRRARIAQTEAGVTLARDVLSMSILPPGRYVISASVLPERTARFTRIVVVGK